MRGMYDLKTLSSVSGVSIFGKILESFSLAMSVIFILMMACFTVFITFILPPDKVAQFVTLFFIFLGIFSLLSLLCLAWMAYVALNPLRHLIHWAKEATTFKKIPFSPGDTLEIMDVSGVINELLDRLERSQHLLIQAEKDRTIGQISEQVAHDIRSPLAALDMITSDFAHLEEENRIIARSAVRRIKDIANNLLSQNHVAVLESTSTKKSGHNTHLEGRVCQLIPSLMDALVTEKRMQFRARLNIEIDFTISHAGYGLFADIQPMELERVLSNLVNNSVEALSDSGRISLSLIGNERWIEIRIDDNGKGIPPETLPLLTQFRVSHNKDGGTGLGLYHARTALESWGGSISIESRLDVGTSILLKIPRAQAPEWFVSQLIIQPSSYIVILDDDTSIHQIWQGRLNNLDTTHGTIQEIHHFSSPNQITTWLKDNRVKLPMTVFLVDYELLGHDLTGLDLIEQNQLQSTSILVTSRFEEPGIRARCKKLGVPLIPKSMAGFVPLSVLPDHPKELNLILVDDNDLTRRAWTYSAERANLKIMTFSDPDDLVLMAPGLNLSTPLFFDAQLANGKKGAIEAKLFNEMGFSQIFLATGYDRSSFSEISLKMPWIKAVVGKQFPIELLESISDKNNE